MQIIKNIDEWYSLRKARKLKETLQRVDAALLPSYDIPIDLYRRVYGNGQLSAVRFTIEDAEYRIFPDHELPQIYKDKLNEHHSAKH